MENLVLTQLSIPEIRQIFRQELETFFANATPQAEAPAKDKLLSVDEAAAFLNLSTSTIYTQVSQNTIPYHKRSKRLYFSEQELTDWLKGGRKSPVEEQAKTYRKAKRRA